MYVEYNSRSIPIFKALACLPIVPSAFIFVGADSAFSWRYERSTSSFQTSMFDVQLSSCAFSLPGDEPCESDAGFVIGNEDAARDLHLSCFPHGTLHGGTVSCCSSFFIWNRMFSLPILILLAPCSASPVTLTPAASPPTIFV